jgi:hypothetical protein
MHAEFLRKNNDNLCVEGENNEWNYQLSYNNVEIFFENNNVKIHFYVIK